jgi:hypothetical protein
MARDLLRLESLSPYNEAVRLPGTASVVTPRNTSELVAAIAEARQHSRTLSICSTGHDFEGRSLSGELILNLGAFTGTFYDPETTRLTVGGATRVAAINDTLRPHGRAISTGTNQDVGIAGLAMGGGAAYTSRSRGLTCDALVEVELVTWGGQVLRLNDASEPALMRLVRGAGGGWLGAVTTFVFETYETSPVTAFGGSWSWQPGLLGRLEQALVSAPRALSMRVGTNITGADCTLRVTVSGQVMGGDEALLARHLAGIPRPADWHQRTMPYAEAMAGARHVTSGGAFRVKSRFAPRPVGTDTLEAMAAHVGNWPPTRNPDGAGFGLFAWGGAVADMPRARSCAAGRDAHYLASFDTSWTAQESAADIARQDRWLRDLDELAAPHMAAGGYINFPDSDDDAFANRHLSGFADELVAARLRCDPDGLGRQVSLYHSPAQVTPA